MNSTGLSKLLAAVALAGSLIGAQAAAGAASGTWGGTGALGTARSYPGAASLLDGRVLVAGGLNSGGNPTALAELYNPATGTFTPTTGTMNSSRAFPGAAQLLDGRALVVGGYGNGGPNYLNTAETFNPATGTFTNTAGNMGSLRGYPAVASLADGRVLVAGGYDGANNLQTTEIFNPATGTFSAGPNMTVPRSEASAASLPDGRVLIAGGCGATCGTLVATAEVYNPATNSFSAVGSMATVRRGAAGSPLSDGRALVTGGSSSTTLATSLSSAEAFDPATNTFTSTGIGSMAAARYGPGVGPLRDGRVLAAGGFNIALPPLTSAELFTLAPPNKTLKFTVSGTSLVFTTEVPGKIDVTSETKGTNAKKGKGKNKGRKKGKPKQHLLLNPSTGSGGPGTITVPLNLTGTGNALLKRFGSLALNAKIVFTPRGDECLKRFFDSCYSAQYATTETQSVTVVGKKKKKKKKKKKR